MRDFRDANNSKRKAIAKSGFSLLEVAITVALMSIIILVAIGWQVNEFKEQKSREIASTLLAIDIAYYQIDTIIKNVNANYNIPIPNGVANTTTATFDTYYVCAVRNTGSWRNLPAYSGSSAVLVDNYLDPRMNLTKLARDGYTFTFNTNGSRVLSITVSGLDSDMNTFIAAMLGNKYNSGTYSLNNGNGYPISWVNYTCN